MKLINLSFYKKKVGNRIAVSISGQYWQHFERHYKK